MKTLLFLALAVAAATLGACSQDPPPKHVYHHTHRDSGPSVGSTTDEGSDNFRAVQKPDTYSGQ